MLRVIFYVTMHLISALYVMRIDLTFKQIIYQLVLDCARRGNKTLRVKDILATFTHPEAEDLEKEAKLWFHHNKCHLEDIILVVERDLMGYLIVPKIHLGQQNFKVLI